MAPNLFGTSALFLSEATTEEKDHALPSTSQHYTPVKIIVKSKENKYPWEIVWRNVIAFVYLHVAGLYGLYLCFCVCNWRTFTIVQSELLPSRSFIVHWHVGWLTWLVNSAAHIWGNKTYDKTIGPTQNIYVSIAAEGEGWHNYHHIFLWDYKAAELGNYKSNFSTMIIDFFARIGWAYDLKTVSLEMIEKRAKRTGDGTKKAVKE